MSITERIDEITGIAPEYRAEIVPAPKSVKIELTSKCNYRCSFCAQVLHLREQGEMDKELFRRIVHEMLDEGVREIGLFYLGESMMVPWLDEAIYYCKSRGCEYVFLTTNGSLAKPARLEKLFRAGLDSLKFSLNYADKEQFTEIARVTPRLFDIMMSNIIASREVRDRVQAETGHKCGLYASYIQYDDAQNWLMERWVNMLAPMLDEVYALPLYNQASLVSTNVAGWRITAGNQGRIGALREPIPCWSVFTEGHVTYDGKLSACCFDHDGRFEMGDLTQQSFMSAWNSEPFQKLRRAHLAGDVVGTACEKCAAYT